MEPAGGIADPPRAESSHDGLEAVFGNRDLDRSVGLRPGLRLSAIRITCRNTVRLAGHG